ncbi:DUF4397 domain-containing protein [Microcella sp.]|uniref:DUF4397 domain-containing protein n=1 Tax=Microcella sp. TaxID=1913979 RepID=UPI002568B269|nr:DUF4397 domain-containing protein [Microcella sp.]MBX9470603.1 DUF4397 domain-containing protein [Microcella sp.]
MRNRILAGLGVAALATVGVAAPANALSSTTADVWVVHAFPGVTVDVFINGDLAIDAFAPGDVEPLVDVPAGNYVIDIAADSADTTITPGDGLFGTGAGGVDVAAATSYSLVAHPNTSGDPILTPFVNDLSSVGAGNASVTVRHTANAPAVNVVALPDTVLFAGVTNTQAGTTSVPAGTYDIQVQVAADDSVAIDLPDTALAAGTHYFIHAFGPQSDDSFGVVLFTIADSPAGVPAGSAGLAAENGAGSTGLIAGGAALLALLIAGGVIVARRMTAEQR